MEAVYRLYAGLSREMDPQTGLGGKLFYAGEVDTAGCMVLRAANVAGAASLAASADAAALRTGMRAGALDFVVNSLDEALRILKNQIRKKEPVAVGISVPPEALLAEMEERGVQPDLLAPGLPSGTAIAAFTGRGAQTLSTVAEAGGGDFRVFPIPAEWNQPAAAFDALLLGSLEADDHVNRRWVRRAPRYLPAECRRLRSLLCDATVAARLRAAAGHPDWAE